MTVVRLWAWTCDHDGCDAVLQDESYGVPEGWVWVHEPEGGTTHRCPEHAVLVPPEVERGVSGTRKGWKGAR